MIIQNKLKSQYIKFSDYNLVSIYELDCWMRAQVVVDCIERSMSIRRRPSVNGNDDNYELDFNMQLFMSANNYKYNR